MNTLMLIVVVCIPLMLCVKPCYLQHCAKKAHHKVVEDDDFVQGGEYATHDVITGDNFVEAPMTGEILKASGDAFNLHDNIVNSFVDASKMHADESFMEIMIHQIIEVIEFVLGTISNTASYLRLWALSLAHSQLAKVFYDRALVPGFQSSSVLMMFMGFFIFIGATFGVLMIMDVMECFLHTLRLHWVEFMSKFYKGDGLKFNPTSIKQVFVATGAE
jgi:vacuolar-type H+-ATPase subunit I/STV1